MRWHDLLFLHWELQPNALGVALPHEVELDTRDGHAWLSIVAFRMSGVRLRQGIGMPGATKFPELNLRTYVRVRGVPAIWFLSLDATSRPMVETLRRWFHLPYLKARAEVKAGQDATSYDFLRRDKRGEPATFKAEVEPRSAPEQASGGSLDHFLSERYAFVTQDRRGHLRLGHVHHRPYPLQAADVTIATNQYLERWPTLRPTQPDLASFARGVDVLAWTLRAP